VLALTAFFLGITFLAQCIPVKFTEKITQNIPEQISSGNTEKEYEDQGEVGKTEIAKIKYENKTF